MKFASRVPVLNWAKQHYGQRSWHCHKEGDNQVFVIPNDDRPEDYSYTLDFFLRDGVEHIQVVHWRDDKKHGLLRSETGCFAANDLHLLDKLAAAIEIQVDWQEVADA